MLRRSLAAFARYRTASTAAATATTTRHRIDAAKVQWRRLRSEGRVSVHGRRKHGKGRGRQCGRLVQVGELLQLLLHLLLHVCLHLLIVRSLCGVLLLLLLHLKGGQLLHL